MRNAFATHLCIPSRSFPRCDFNFDLDSSSESFFVAYILRLEWTFRVHEMPKLFEWWSESFKASKAPSEKLNQTFCAFFYDNSTSNRHEKMRNFQFFSTFSQKLSQGISQRSLEAEIAFRATIGNLVSLNRHRWLIDTQRLEIRWGEQPRCQCPQDRQAPTRLNLSNWKQKQKFKRFERANAKERKCFSARSRALCLYIKLFI